jgi:hypothetical protein
MTTLRWSRALVTDPKLRWAKATLTGTGTTPKLRWSKATVTGTAPLSLQPIADQTAEALDTVTLTAVPGATSPTPTSYAWRQISGPATPYSDNGGSISFTVPPVMGSASLVFGVTAYIGSQASAEVTATVKPIPHLYWVASSTGWVALTRTARA